jgi:hypothetical protein
MQSKRTGASPQWASDNAEFNRTFLQKSKTTPFFAARPSALSVGLQKDQQLVNDSRT